MSSRENDDPLLDSLSLMTGYAWRALKRRWLLALGCFGLTVGLSIVFLLVSSPVYRVETRLMVAPTDKMTQLVAPGRVTVPVYRAPDQSPIASVPQLVESRQAYTWLINE